MEISSWPWALRTFKFLIILIISSSLKFKVQSLDEVNKIWLVESTLSFFKDVHWSAKKLLKLLAFVCISVTNLSSIKRGGNIGIFCRYKRV